MKSFFRQLRCCVIGAACAGMVANAQPASQFITGIFSYLNVLTLDKDDPDFASATAITGFDSVRSSIVTGLYTNVPNSTAVTCAPFVFNPAVTSVPAFFALTNGGVIYSFDATSVSVVTHDSTSMGLAGTGIAHVTGYRDTPGTWQLTTQTPGGDYEYTFSCVVKVNVTNVPVLTVASQTKGQMVFAWNALPGQPYQMQWATNLSQTNWSDFGGMVGSTNNTAGVTNFIGVEAQRYYRIRLGP